MLKTILLATSMLVSAPVFAQDAKPTTPPAQTAPTTTAETSPVTDDAAPDATTETETAATPQATPAPAGQTVTQPAQAATQSAPATGQPAASANAAARPAPATKPAASQDQIAQAVGRDFATYDKDSDGALSAAEFGSWMGTLRKASEPGFAPDSPEAKTWASQAFTSASADKSATIDKQEVTAFLTPKPS